jgi:hypothetical protein
LVQDKAALAKDLQQETPGTISQRATVKSVGK